MSPTDWEFLGMWIAAALALTAEITLNYLVIKDPDVLENKEDSLKAAAVLGIIRFALFGLCGILFYSAWL